MSEPLANLLLVDDDPAVGKVLGALLRQAGFAAEHVESGEKALERLECTPVDLVISDLRMPRMDGLELLKQIQKRWSDVPVVMLTAFGTVSIAVDCMKAGAVDFAIKPFDRDEILFVVKKALLAAAPARAAVPEPPTTARAVTGGSVAMREVQAIIARAAPSSATVLIRGESGTGKELVARAIHEQSPRAAGPFIKVHCAALPDNLLESELFGYEKGAFTGATQRKPGRVELAESGTLFLDEIGDITPALQVKLLRVLQDREYERLGGTRTERADVRFVAATHRDLEAMVSAEEFREDLFYRLNVVPIWLPPLRERPDDIERLARHFCAELGSRNRKPGAGLDARALELLCAEAWPGNVRQLQNFIERLVVLSPAALIGADDVQREIERELGPSRAVDRGPEAGRMDMQRDRAERDALENALRRTENNRVAAARLLGVSRRTLYNKLAKFGLLVLSGLSH